jgi:ADP-ribosylglycohydrolase
VNGAREASISTHGGTLAIAAAAATAAAVSAALDAASPAQVLMLAERAAAHAECRSSGRPDTPFASAIRTIHDDLSRLPALAPEDVATRWLPNQPLTIVPLALGLATTMRSAEDAILLAANIGGDSDSVGSIVGGILGAMYPNTVNQHWYEVIARINDHDLVGLANELAPLRH